MWTAYSQVRAVAQALAAADKAVEEDAVAAAVAGPVVAEAAAAETPAADRARKILSTKIGLSRRILAARLDRRALKRSW